MKKSVRTMDIIALCAGVLFLVVGRTDIQLGFGIVLCYLGVRGLLTNTAVS